MTKGCLHMLDVIFGEDSIRSGTCPLRPFLRRTRNGSAQGQGSAQFVATPRSPIAISATPVSPIRGASRQNRSSLCDHFIGPRRKKVSSRRLIAPVKESLSFKRSKYLCSDLPSKLPTNGSVNR